MQEQTEANYMLFKIAPIYDYSFLDSWFEPLMFSIPGKIVFAICGMVILVKVMFMMKYTKSIKYRQ